MTEPSKTNPGTLRPQLKRMLEEDHLDDRQFAELQQLLEGDKPRSTAGKWRREWWLASAASLLLLVGTLLAWTLNTSGGEIPSRIAEEVTTNHIHLHPLDIRTSSMQQVRRALDRLDFVPVSPPAAEGDRLILLGARYCTLQGAIATQLMFRTADGTLVTYYQAAYDPHRFGLLPDIQRRQPLTLVKQGVEIRLWVEHGVVMAQARTSAPTPV